MYNYSSFHLNEVQSYEFEGTGNRERGTDHKIRVCLTYSRNAVKVHRRYFRSATLYTIDTLKLGQKNVEGLVLSVYWHPIAFPRNLFDKEAKKL
jgi:hypothetical protein